MFRRKNDDTCVFAGVCFDDGYMAWVDPFDADEAYVNRGAPEMMGIAGLGMIMLNYVLFSLAIVVFGKAMLNHAPWLERMARIFARP